MQVTFNELAEYELNDAVQYYETEQPGLGLAFLAEVRRCTEALLEYPESGAIILGTTLEPTRHVGRDAKPPRATLCNGFGTTRPESAMSSRT